MLHNMCMQGWLRGHASSIIIEGGAFRRVPYLVKGYAVSILKFLITLEQRDLRFRFALSLLCIM